MQAGVGFFSVPNTRPLDTAQARVKCKPVLASFLCPTLGKPVLALADKIRTGKRVLERESFAIQFDTKLCPAETTTT